MSARLTTLPSGLRVVTDASPHLRTAALGIFVGVGSRHERDEEHGLSHMLEHMAFKGTRKRNARQIAEAIENVGGDLNAETSVEQTGYFAHVLREDAKLAMDVLGDILTDSQFDPEELTREKNVIVQEIGAVEDTPDDHVFDLLTEAAWPDQAIGRPILGTRERVNAFDRAAIDGYLDRHYRAGSTLVVGSGAVDHDELVDLAEARLSGLSKAEAERAAVPGLVACAERHLHADAAREPDALRVVVSERGASRMLLHGVSLPSVIVRRIPAADRPVEATLPRRGLEQRACQRRKAACSKEIGHVARAAGMDAAGYGAMPGAASSLRGCEMSHGRDDRRRAH